MTQSEYKILVAVPCLTDIKAETASSLITYYRNAIFPTQIRFYKDTYTHAARNRAAWDALKLDATHLVFVDSDMKFSKTTIDTLVKHTAEKSDITGVLYFRRISPHRPVIKRIVDHSLHDYTEYPKDQEFFSVDAIGTGIMCIDTVIFKNLHPDWFKHELVTEFGLKPQKHDWEELGEDMYFCVRAIKEKYNIDCYNDPSVAHIGEKEFTSLDFSLLDNKN